MDTQTPAVETPAKKVSPKKQLEEARRRITELEVLLETHRQRTIELERINLDLRNSEESSVRKLEEMNSQLKIVKATLSSWKKKADPNSNEWPPPQIRVGFKLTWGDIKEVATLASTIQ